MSVISNNQLAGAAGQGGADAGYTIQRSLRFNSGDSSYLSRTPSSAGNRRTWTWSAWVKLSSTSTGRSRLFGACGANTGSPYNFATDIGLSGNKIVFTNSANDIYTTDAVFRDFSAWYHIVVTLDTTDATTANRVKIYVNGVLQDKTHPGHGGAGEPSQNTEYAINNTDPHNSGSTPNTSGTATSFFDGYLADVHFIDGQALDPTDFGEYDDNNVWQAKEATLSTQYLTSAITSVTALNTSFTTDAGTANAFGSGSITEGTFDRKTNGGVLDVTLSPAQSGNFVVYTGANNESSNYTIVFEYGDGTTETVLNNSTSPRNGPGYTCTVSVGQRSNVVGFTVDCQDSNDSQLCGVTVDGTKLVTGQSSGSQVTLTDGTNLDQFPVDTVVSNGDKVIARDTTNNTLSLDGTSWAPGQYVTKGGYGANGFHLDFSTSDLGADAAGSNDWTPNNLSGTAPGLSTANQGFDVVTYTGNGSTQSISGLSMSPDLVWIKMRSTTGYSHKLVDQVRGATKSLVSNNSNAELTETSGLTAFTSDGFSLGSQDPYNRNNDTFVAFCWKAGGTAVSNTDGTITSSVSASTTYGFSVVSYTGNNTSGATVGHGLSSVPKWIVIKSRDQSGQYWHVYHSALDADEYIYLNVTNAKTSGNDFMNGTRPTSSVFSLGNGNACNKSSDDVIAYCWSEISGFSKFGSYSGTGATGHKITTGFKPAWILFKRTDSVSNWRIVDRLRGTASLNAETSEAEQTLNFAINDDGFTINETGNNPNASGGSYIYAAFAGKPDGSIIDSLIDTPTNYEASPNNGGNYATLNPLANALNLTNGNISFDIGARANWKVSAGTVHVASGKWYWEATNGTQNSAGGNIAYGLRATDASSSFTNELGYNDGNKAYFASGITRDGTTSSSSYGATFGTNDIIGVAFDADAGTLVFYKNGISQGTAFTGLTGSWSPAVGLYTGGTQIGTDNFDINFGQRPFSYTPPTGFKSLCTTNLPDPTIADGSTYFDTKLYTGNGSSQTISGFSFSPDFAWFKNRATTKDPRITDTIRGTGVELYSNSTSGDYSQPQGVTAFNSDGVSVGSDGGYNGSGQGMVLWAWDAGSSNTSISAGSLNSTAYDQSQTWSSQITGTSYSGYPKTRVFNNNNTENALPADNNELVFTPSPSFSNASTVKIWYYYPSTHANAFKINGTAVGNDVAQTSTVLTHTFNVSGFTSLSWSRNKYGSEDTGIARIDVDGVQLVDSSVTVPNVPSIASTVRANPSAGFSIVSYTGTGSPLTVGHGLNSAPEFIIIKRRSGTENWLTYHRSIGATQGLFLNLTNSTNTSTDWFNNTDPSSSVFTLGSGNPVNNNSGDTYIAYCFAPVEGYSAFGSYTGNGSSTDGPFIYTGFKPKFLLARRTDSTQDWIIVDSERSPDNVMNKGLYANLSNAEQTSNRTDFLSNGFKIRINSGELNASGGNYIYACFAEHPFKTARAR